MVKAFCADLSGDKKYYLFDVESGSLHSVDYAAFLVAKNKYYLPQNKDESDRLSATEQSDFKKLAAAAILEIEGELSELERAGVLNAPQTHYDVPFTGEVKALCLNICHDCNLRCPYCFAKDGTYGMPKEYMPEEVGERAIDFLLANCGGRRNLEIDFFGGEPLMNIEVVKHVVDYAKEKAASAGKNINFTLTTNGLLLSDKNIDYLNQTMQNVVISIDGRERVHDALRKTAGGRGSHAAVLENALKFRKVRGDKSYYIRGTFTSQNLDFARDVLYLADKGFDQVSIEPAVLPDSDPLSIRAEHLLQIFSEYDALSKEYVRRRKHNDGAFNFFHFMIDLKNGACVYKRLKNCGAGSEYLAVAPSGDIFPCHQFVSDGAYKMGNVLSGEFDKVRQKDFSQMTVQHREHCQTCAAKYHCSGGCKANSLHFAGDMLSPHKISCEMMKKRFLCALAIYAQENA